MLSPFRARLRARLREARLLLLAAVFLLLLPLAGLAAPAAFAQDTTPTDQSTAPADQNALPADQSAAPAPSPAPAPAPLPCDAKNQAACTPNSGDTAWMLASVALVLMMTVPGLGLFYGGMVRKKNVGDTVMTSFFITCLVTVLWAVCNYSFAFRAGSPLLGGLDRLFLQGILSDVATNTGNPNSLAPTIPETVYMCFQMTVAIITPALIAGSFAERMKFSAMCVFIALWATLVYAPVAHWVWGPDGFLNSANGAAYVKVLDFAGGTVVSINSGVAGLMTALVLGKRKDTGPAHNVVLTFIGAALLWVGWFGFNAGSALSAGPLASTAFVNTHLAAATGALAWAAVEWIKGGKPTVLGAISGAVAGLVAITPASGYTLPMYAMLIGIAAGVVCFFSSTSLKQWLGYDDTLDAFGVHGTGGTLGALLTGVFAVCSVNCPPGLDSAGRLGVVEGNWHPVLNQAIAAGLTWLLAGIGSFVILKIIDQSIGLRVPEADEYDGLDLTQHGESGYNMEEAVPLTFSENSGEHRSKHAGAHG